jgi:Fungal specific transcription factor domain
MATLNDFVFSAAAAEGQGQEVNEPPEATHHLSQAIRLVNQKLSTAEALSASSLSVVNFLVVREMFRGERRNAEIHLMGLKKMVALRGGLERLEGEDRTLVLKICKYFLSLI